MGFDQDRRRKIYELAFRQFGGLRCQMRKPGFGAFARLHAAVLVLGDDLEGDGLAGADRMAGWSDLIDAFADSLVSWDLTDRGRPVPATRKGVRSQDLPFLLALARTWYVMVVQAPEGEPAERSSPAEPDTEAGDPGEVANWLESIPTTTAPPEVPDLYDAEPAVRMEEPGEIPVPPGPAAEPAGAAP